MHPLNILTIYGFLKGPSYTSDAACASGLLVVDIAMKDILSGKCDYALVGAVTVTVRPQFTFTLQQLQVLSPDGICRTFDKSGKLFASYSLYYLEKGTERLLNEKLHTYTKTNLSAFS